MTGHRTGIRWAILAIVAAMLTTTNALHADERAEEILNQMTEYYHSVEHASYDVRLHQRQKMGAQEQESDLRAAVKVERPNRFSFEMRQAGADEPQFVARSNGEQLFAHDANAGRYSTQDAPEDFDAIVRLQSLLQVTQGVIELGLSPMVDEPMATMLAEAVDRSYEGEREVEGETYNVVRLDTNDQVAFELLITTGDQPRLHQVTFDLSERLESIREETGQEIEADIFVRYESWNADADIADEAFAFAPPEGAEEVASLIQRPAHPLEGGAAPEFELERLGGGQGDLASHEGEDILILDFWATWCGPCVRAMPMIIEVAEEYKDRNVVFYAVNLRESEEEINAFLEEHGMEIDNVLLDRQGRIGNAYGARSIPQTVVVGKDGMVHSVHVGFTPDLKESLSSDIEALLAE